MYIFCNIVIPQKKNESNEIEKKNFRIQRAQGKAKGW